jgi:hypothetical protein
MGKQRVGDIDAIRSALRPRISGTSASTSVPAHSHTTVPVHTHSADTVTVEPEGNIAADDVQEALEELDAEKLARDGSQTMLGALDMDHHSISNCDDADIEGTATIGEDAQVGRDITLTGAAGAANISGARVVTMKDELGSGVVDKVRLMHFVGDSDDGEAGADGIHFLIFNNDAAKSYIENLGDAGFITSYIPGVSVPTLAEGWVSWSEREHMFVADSGLGDDNTSDQCVVALGNVVQRWLQYGEGYPAITRFTVVYKLSDIGSGTVFPFAPDEWPYGASTLAAFGVAMHSVPTAGYVLVMQNGVMRDLDTSAWAAGDPLWVAYDGTLTNVRPTYTDPVPVVFVGVVRESSATAGSVDIDLRVFPPHEVFSGRFEADAHPASAITYTPGAGELTDTDVQSAIDSLDVGKVGRALYYPDTLTVVAGTLVSGDVDDLADLAGNEVHIDETATTPGFDIILDWSGIPAEPTQVILSLRYTGNLSHVPTIECWNYVLGAWVQVEVLLDAPSHRLHSIPSWIDFVDYGAMRVRINHAQAGNPAHEVYLKYAAVRC